MALDPHAGRKLHAKRANERVKLLYSTVNALAIGMVGAAFVVPGVTSADALLEPQRWIWILIAVALHSVAYLIVGWLRSED